MNEQRLIDGNLLAEYIRKIDMPYETKTTVLCTVNTMPTIDPVQHGKWELINDDCCVCSVCHNASSQGYYYCPECGAKMDEE